MRKAVTVRVPGKVNIYLGVGPKEFSGFHELATIFQSVSVYDDITVSSADSFSISVSGRHADQIPTDSSNLVWKATHLVAQACGEDPNVNVHIDKSIPVAAGMAGGNGQRVRCGCSIHAPWRMCVGRGSRRRTLTCHDKRSFLLGVCHLYSRTIYSRSF